MSDKKFHKVYMNNSDSPIPIPAPDSAWDNMRRKLDDKMPEGAGYIPGTAGNGNTLLRRGIAGGLLLLLLLLVWFIFNNKGSQRGQHAVAGNTGHASENAATASGSKHNTNTPAAGNNILPEMGRKNGGQNFTLTADEKDKKRKQHTILKKTHEIDRSNPGKTDDAPDQGNNEPPVINIPDSANKTATLKKELSKKDSLAKSPEPPITTKEKWRFKGGIQWYLQLPVNGTGGYFMGPNGRSQPYLAMIPGLWLLYHNDQFMFSFEVNPFYSMMLPDKTFDKDYDNFRSGDTLQIITKNLSLQKVFGLSAEIGYKQKIGGNWWYGGNLRVTRWRSAAVLERVDDEKRSSSGSFSSFTNSSATTYKLPKQDWEDFAKVQLHLNFEALYRTDKWQAGLKAGMPFTPLAKKSGPSNPFYAELFFRYVLLK